MVGQHSTPEWGHFVGKFDSGSAGRGDNWRQISLKSLTQTSWHIDGYRFGVSGEVGFVVRYAYFIGELCTVYRMQ